jgi:hypothetical protein
MKASERVRGDFFQGAMIQSLKPRNILDDPPESIDPVFGGENVADFKCLSDFGIKCRTDPAFGEEQNSLRNSHNSGLTITTVLTASSSIR